MFYRVQTYSRAQILQELNMHCQALAGNKNRGFKQEFDVSLFRNWFWFVKLEVGY